ncbi:MAG: polysaccharide deacetylase family protein [Bacillota bacterium]|nr:polysaccharide deacetylase family protein [Bacillota bacterium]
MRARKGYTVVWTRRALVRFLSLGTAALLLGLSPYLYGLGLRYCRGVKPGVTLAGRPVGLLLAHELRKAVQELAGTYYRPARSAYFDPASQRVIPEEPGQELAVEETVQRVLAARPGEEVQPVLRQLRPLTVARQFTPVYRGESGRPLVALMFNVAWGEEELPRLLTVLAEKKVRATFFVVGTWARRFPHLVRELSTGGHEVANHGLEHVHPATLAEEEVMRLIIENEHLLKELGCRPAKLFAPPYGEVSPQMVRVAAALGYYTVLWTADTVDWKRPRPEVILRRAEKGAQPGGLLLMHPTAPTVSALPLLIDALRRAGLEPATVSQVLGLEGSE